MLKRIVKNNFEILLHEGLMLLISAFLFTSAFRLMGDHTAFYNPYYLEKASLAKVIIWLIPAYITLHIIRIFTSRVYTLIAMMVSSFIYAMILVSEAKFSSYLNFGVAVILFLIAYYTFKSSELNFASLLNFSNKTSYIILFTSVLLMGLFLTLTTIARYEAYLAFNFDFGIFAQMFSNMAKTGQALVTCERDRLLTHFAVHISPVYYLLLPVYYVFRSPNTLLVLQAFAIASAAIPVYFLCKTRGLSNLYSLIAAEICLIYPPFIAGAYFDFHENVFLSVFILWLIYFYEKKKIIPIVLFTLLTLSVKEDAALYVIFLCGYFLFSNIKKIKITALVSLVTAIAYFCVCMNILESMGLGPMVTRFNNYMTVGDTGFFSVFENILFNPSYLINQLFNEEKIAFIVNMILPLAMLPFVLRKPKYILLILPMVVVNIMPNYVYQYRIGYQYVYGSGALLIYLFIRNFASMADNWRKNMTSALALMYCFVLLAAFVGSPIKYYVDGYFYNKADIKLTSECLERIPADAEITASTYLLTHLTDHEVLYMYPSKNDTEYLVLDTRHDKDIKTSEKNLQKIGYELVDSGGFALVYRNSDLMAQN